MCLTKKKEDDEEPKVTIRKHGSRTPFRFSISARKFKVGQIAAKPKFVIIGAGAAGVACATQLLKDGFSDVSIIEASNRVGGRIHTIAFADNVVDMGAQWCHGERGNVVYELVKDKNVLETTGDIYVTFECIRSNGDVVPAKTVKALKKLLSNIFNNRHHDLKRFEGSFGAFLTKRFYRALGDSNSEFIDSTIATEFFDNFKRMESSETAAGIDDISGRGFANYWECHGDYMLNWRDKGFGEFFRIITNANHIGNEYGVLEDRILFNSLVEKINWDRDDAKVEVVCAGAKKLLADHVILTVSLGVLKAYAGALFHPELPESKKRAISAMGFGDVGKIFLEFPEQFWPAGWTGFATLWREEDYVELRATKDAWLEDIYGFYCVNYQPRVLVAWIVGQYVKHMEQLNTSKVEKGCMYLLRRFLKDWNIPEPVKLVKTAWSSDKLIGGAYSFWSMKMDEVHTTPNELAQPLTKWTAAPALVGEGEHSSDEDAPLAMKPLVLFAGEATSKHYFSTVHGAVESGWREAGRLAGYYGLDL